VKIDSTQNDIPGIEIKSFPTLKFWKKDKTLEPLDFKGNRNVDGIISWIKDNT